ncbi:MAG: SDR family oxidoreductase [Pelagibacteraceae bacterium]|jgi:NAD(P)-dependent dehydrogenase (short-subunit alcohol dehydrogenase family)|nr:SDR family oxidoreductase [Pelagibacteraceae bacterium]MBT6197755.1 SDR family oxidoreductase [Pelagibacteraceae bacterium]MBT6354066.1 SDR family oxidoreductase [Pelagibacteraceae bacterium]
MNKYISNNSKQFDGKVIIVTGSTQGSGSETAKLFAARGAKAITICGRQENKGNQIKKEIEELGSKCLYVKADLSNVEDCKKIVALTDQEFGTVHSLVNVAGYTERGTILSATLENYENNFNVNTRAPFILIQEAIKIMIRDKHKGTIANVLSMAMYSGMPFILAYSGSKAALAIMTKNIANSVAGYQIRVNALNIGWTDTPAEHDIQIRVHKKNNDWLQKEEKKVPFKRLIKPLDVAKGLAFICSEESGLMTGSVIDFDQTVNGWHSYSAYDTKILDDSLLGE